MRNKKIIQHWDTTLIQLCLEELSYPSAVSPGFTGCHKCVENPCAHVVSFRESTEVEINSALRASALLSGTFLGFGGTSLRGVLCAILVRSCCTVFCVTLPVLGAHDVLFDRSELNGHGLSQYKENGGGLNPWSRWSRTKPADACCARFLVHTTFKLQNGWSLAGGGGSIMV